MDANGDEYIGNWKDGVKDGSGIFTWHKSGSRYDGEWKDDVMEGKGEKFYAGGSSYTGDWREG